MAGRTSRTEHAPSTGTERRELSPSGLLSQNTLRFCRNSPVCCPGKERTLIMLHLESFGLADALNSAVSPTFPTSSHRSLISIANPFIFLLKGISFLWILLCCLHRRQRSLPTSPTLSITLGESHDQRLPKANIYIRMPTLFPWEDKSWVCFRMAAQNRTSEIKLQFYTD